MNYENEICMGCGKILTQNDDIVVCPECATPQHRECWKKNNRCVNENLHSPNFIWSPRNKEKLNEEPPKEEIKEVAVTTCPLCGHENPADADACENCGQPFVLYGYRLNRETKISKKNEEVYSYKPPFTIGEDTSSFSSEPEIEQEGFNFNGEILENTILGSSTKEFSIYIRAGVVKYYKKFKKAEKGNHLNFNFAAFFFGAFWFFYRKIWKAGILFLTLAMCLSIIFSPYLTEFTQKSNELIAEVQLQVSEYENKDEINQDLLAGYISEKYEKIIENYGKYIVLSIFLSLLIQIVMGFSADLIYRKKFTRDMVSINKEAGNNEQKRFFGFVKKGGVSYLLPLIAAVCYWLIPEVIQLLITGLG